MTKDQIIWLMKSNEEHVEKNSFRNCHAPGLHSIGIFSNQTNGLRLFLADQNHTLDRNQPRVGKHQYMSIGFHRHRRDIMLQHVAGERITNISADIEHTFGSGSVPLHLYTLPSSIVDGRDLAPKRSKHPVYANNIHPVSLSDQRHYMLSEEWHTVSLPEYKASIWAIHEGRYADNHLSQCATDDPLLKKGWDADLYKPMGFTEAFNLFNYVWERCQNQR